MSQSYFNQIAEAAKKNYDINQFDEALKILAKTDKQKHNNYNIYYVYGIIYMKKKELKKAEEYLLKAVEVDDKAVKAVKAKKATAKKNILAHLRLMKLYNMQGDISKADGEAIITKELSKTSSEDDQFKANSFLCDFYHSRKQWDECKKYCDLVLNFPRAPVKEKVQFMLFKVDCHLRLSELIECKALLDEIKALKEKLSLESPKLYSDALSKEFEYLKFSGNFKEALAKVENEYSNCFKEEFYRLGCLKIVTYYYMKNYDKVIEIGKDIIEAANSKNVVENMKKFKGYGWPILFYISCSLKNQGKFEEYSKFISLIREHYKNGTDNEEFHLETAKYHFAIKQYEKAEQIIEKALRCKKSYIPAIKFKIYLYKVMGRTDEAEKVLKDNLDKIQEYKSYQDSVKTSAIDSKKSEDSKKADENKPTVESISCKFDEFGNENFDEDEKEKENLIVEEPPATTYQAPAPKIIKELASGGFGVVTVEEFEGQQYACKHLKNMTPEKRAEIIKEVRSMINLDHDNIVKVEGYSMLEGKIMMEYCDAGDLFDLIQKRFKVLTVKNKIYFSLGIARGLEYIHSMDIIHSDMKTKNVLLKAIKKDSNEIEDLMPKICDFGLSVVAETEDGKMDVDGMTPNYAAPEVFEERNVCKEDDIFSFGMTILALFTGKEPFEGKNVPTIMEKLRSRNLPDPDTEIKDSKVPDEIKDLINECLKERAERPTAENICERLEEVFTNC
ncbi:MAG: protein kinase [archaeon]|nr:protein kinase [archaeon]